MQIRHFNKKNEETTIKKKERKKEERKKEEKRINKNRGKIDKNTWKKSAHLSSNDVVIWFVCIYNLLHQNWFIKYIMIQMFPSFSI